MEKTASFRADNGTGSRSLRYGIQAILWPICRLFNRLKPLPGITARRPATGLIPTSPSPRKTGT